MPEPTLLRLPRELRDIIFSHILPKRIKLIQADSGSTSNSFDNNGIFLASHQLHSEAFDALYRQLPNTTLVASQCSIVHLLESPRTAYLRDSIQDLIVQREYVKCGPLLFRLRHTTDEWAGMPLARIIQSMHALRQLTFEIRWQTNYAPSVLLPAFRNMMLVEFLRVTVGKETLAGWDVECQVVDTTRWKKELSGVVVLKKILGEGYAVP